MSLGLFTVDEDGHLWFDMDCHLTHPAPFFPKHFVFNINQNIGRVLLLHTAYLQHVHNAADVLLSMPSVSGSQVAQDIQEVINALPCDEYAFARVVAEGANGWEYFKLSPEGLEGPIQIGCNELAFVGVAWEVAEATWNASVQFSTGRRLRGALQAAANVCADVVIPSIRQPVRIDRCVRQWAYPSELLS